MLTTFLDAVALTPLQLLALSIVVLLAACVRGFAGFGFGAILLAAGTFVIPPAQLVPVSLALEILATATMLPSIWRHINWRAVLLLSVGAMLTMPIGQILLTRLPVDTSRLVVSTLILALTLMLFKGFTWKSPKHGPLFGFAGLVSGLVNGIAAIGGIVCTLGMLAVGAAPAAVRATTAMYLMSADVYAITIGYVADTGLFGTTVWYRVAALCVPLVIGIWLGTRQFEQISEQSWRRFAFILVITLSLAGIARIVFDLTRAT